MADKVSYSSTLTINTEYVDTDTRALKLKNPGNITSEDIISLETLIKNGATGSNSLLIGDKNGSDFKRITKATKTNKTITDLDLTGD